MNTKPLIKILPILLVIFGASSAFNAEAQSADLSTLDFIKENKSSFDFTADDEFKIIIPGTNSYECRIRCEEAFDLQEKSEPLNLITFDSKYFTFEDRYTSDASHFEGDPFCACFGRKIEVKVPTLPEKDPELSVILDPLFKCDFSNEKFEQRGDWRFNFSSSEIADTGMALYTPLTLGSDVKAGLGLAGSSNFEGLKGIVGVGFEIKTSFGPISFVCGLLVDPSDVLGPIEPYF